MENMFKGKQQINNTAMYSRTSMALTNTDDSFTMGVSNPFLMSPLEPMITADLG